MTKSVVNSCLSPRKANKINGLLVQGPHRREEQNIDLFSVQERSKLIILDIFKNSIYKISHKCSSQEQNLAISFY